jgi:hypothetical protein
MPEAFGKEQVVFFEILQPFCSRTYGTAPCQAVLGTTGSAKCHNSRVTCQDSANYSGTDQVLLRFCRPQDAVLKWGNTIPSLRSVSTTPASANLGGMDRNLAALGQHEVVSVVLDDHRHSDHQVDKYRLERLPLATVSAGYEANLWTVGASAPSGYALNQDIAGESAFAARSGPYGAPEVVNVCQSLDTPAGDPGPDGGWTTTNVIPIDKTKGHLFLCWFKRLTAGVFSGSNCSAYWGLHSNSASDVLTLAGASETNPYFQATALATFMPSADKWYLAAGYVHANGYGTTDTNLSGVYDPATLTRIVAGLEFKWPSDVTACGHRAYHYYNQSISGEIQQMARPIVVACTEAEAPALIKRYALGAGYDPWTRGSFWTKWLARNPYFVNYRCRVRIGTADQALAAMTVRSYVLDAIEGPDEAGRVTVTAKDLFSRLEGQKAMAPAASRGALSADLTGTPASFTAVPAGIGNLQYQAAGYVAIGDEIIQFTRSADVFTIVARGAFGTTQADHKQEDLVQQVLRYSAQRAHDVVYDLLLNYGNVPAASLPKGDWDAAMISITALYTANIAAPTPVQDLVGELSEQVGFTAWHDTLSDQVQMAPLRASSPTVVIGNDDLLAGAGLQLKKQTDRRASQVWVYYAQINPKKDLGERANYRSRLVSVDLGSEGADKYGTPAIREVFSRWIPQFGQSSAKDCADRLLTMFVDPPTEAQFRLHASREGELELARYFTLEVGEVLDELGQIAPVTMATRELSREDDELAVRAQSVAFGVTPPPATETVIWLDSDAYNVNMRDVYDQLYAAPVGTEVVTFRLIGGVTIGSSTTGAPALRTGSWPAGVALKLITENGARVIGRAGDAGAGGAYFQNGFPGAAGGDALQADRALTVYNSGALWSGGGGGGGGGGLTESGIPVRSAGGGGGGGGGGRLVGSGAPGGAALDSAYNGDPGANGTESAGGAAGSGKVTPSGSRASGNGGRGGDPGQAGGDGQAALADVFVFKGTGGAGGAVGRYIVGNGNVTWLTLGDRRGGVA